MGLRDLQWRLRFNYTSQDRHGRALAGVVLGYIYLAGAIMLPIRMIFRHVLPFSGLLEVFHHLIGYPLLDLLSGLEGDFHTIYSLLPIYGAVLAGLIHLILLALLRLSWQRPPTRDLLRR